MLREVPRQVWTVPRRLMGNLIPTIICLPFGVAGVLRFRPEEPLAGTPFVLLGVFVAVGWLATNLFGYHANGAMRSEMRRLWLREGGDADRPHWFVGMARPRYRNLLDPHEDVGFLILHDGTLEFFGEHVRVRVDREDVRTVRFRANMHTWVGLGRWVSVEGETSGVRFRLLLEPREHPVLLANWSVGAALRRRLTQWASRPSKARA